jgi:hypothetical protein
MPRDGLSGIAIEGLSPGELSRTSSDAAEIADLVLYYGARPAFVAARSVVIVQVKYSIASQSVPFRARDAARTVRKFAATLRSYQKRYGQGPVDEKLAFSLVTNRPICADFSEAIEGLKSGNLLAGPVRRQAQQLASAAGLGPRKLAQFARKLTVVGLAGSLQQNKQSLSKLLVDWSAAPDAIARLRLSNLRRLVRDKAGSAGDGANVVTAIDVLDALEIQCAEDLLPCPASFPNVGRVVKRDQLQSVLERIPSIGKPLLIHADGGVGKTVFLQSLAKGMERTYRTIVFDCFGGGAYRAPEDSRHLPRRGLVQIVNSLACDGLCDPLLPTSDNGEETIRAFRRRIAQAVETLRRGGEKKGIVLLIDAIDNAVEHASDRREPSFPTLLLESIQHGGPISGVHLVVSC